MRRSGPRQAPSGAIPGRRAPRRRRPLRRSGRRSFQTAEGDPSFRGRPDVAKETTVLSGSYGRRQRVKSIIGGSAGNLVEWYDWYVYSAFTLYFAPVFFPSDDPTAQLLSAAAVFAVGFIVRPLGAWVMGVYADRRGRKAGLTLSVTLMCLGSLAI